MSNKIIQIKDGSDNALPVSNDSANNYCKMPDGTLIQWGVITNLSPKSLSGSPSGQIYYHEYDANVTFPVAFVNIPSVLVSPFGGRECSISWVVPSAISFSSFDTLGGRQTLESSVKLNITWIAIGRWK